MDGNLQVERDKAGSPGALAGVRILECGDFFAAPFAAKLLAHLGADVVKIEPPTGDSIRRRGPFRPGNFDPECSGMHLYLNQDKRSVIIDWKDRDSRRSFDRLVENADALIVGGSPQSIEHRGLTYEALKRLNRGIVVTTITPFGMIGPRREWAATDLIQLAAGGWLYVSPGALNDSSREPLKPFGQQSDLQAGLHGAIVTLGGLSARRRSGLGQHIDVSVQACIASNLEMNFVHWTYAGRVASRLGRRALGPWGIVKLQDGLFSIVCVEEDQWQRLAEYLGNPEWAQFEIFSDRLLRAENGDALMQFIEQALEHLTCERAYVELQARRVPCSPVFDIPALLRSDHLRSREFFVEVSHPKAGVLTYPGANFKLSKTPWKISRPAPLLGQSTREVLDQWTDDSRKSSNDSSNTEHAAPLPLEGVRIADFSQVWAGPSATLALALMGADVVKVESSRRIDTTRRLPPYADNIPGPNRAGYFNQYNQQKRSITLNIKDPEGLSVAKDLVKVSDVVIDNFAAGVMNRLGLGYDDLRAVRKDIVAISLSGYGATGPNANFIAYGPIQVPMMGMAYLSGYPDAGPSEIGLSYGDPNAGLNAAIAILAALEYRERTGEGQRIDMSQWEAAIGLTAEAFMSFALTGTQPERQGNRDPVESPQGVFPCTGEDEWIAIACWGDDQWRCLCAAIDRPDLAVGERYSTAAKRKQHEEFIEATIATWTRTLLAGPAAELLQNRGVPAHKVLSNRDLASDDQLMAFGAFSELEHSEVGRKRHIGTPWRFSHSPVRVTRPAPMLGEHTDEVLSQLLGYSEQRIRELRTAEILS